MLLLILLLIALVIIFRPDMFDFLKPALIEHNEPIANEPINKSTSYVFELKQPSPISISDADYKQLQQISHMFETQITSNNIKHINNQLTNMIIAANSTRNDNQKIANMIRSILPTITSLTVKHRLNDLLYSITHS
jgi:hypothetical protein